MPDPQEIGASPDALLGDERSLASLSRLFGSQGLRSLRKRHVVVVGIGGVGSWAAEGLARSGVGHITLIDFDHISVSNINRQVHALHSTLGQSKIEAMRDRMLAIQPGLQVSLVDEFVTPDNWPALLPSNADAVMDCCDQFSAKLVMAQWALAQARPSRIPFLTVGAAGGKRHAQKVELADLSEVTHDPLLAKVRYSLRRAQRAQVASVSLSTPEGTRSQSLASYRKSIGLACVFSREAVQAPARSSSAMAEVHSGGAALNCAGYGSTVTVTATFGFVAAGEIIHQLAQMP
jgi:tRNA A37 threonylcarbamoyladenosine dehydratase